jgi:hypothetical protein
MPARGQRIRPSRTSGRRSLAPTPRATLSLAEPAKNPRHSNISVKTIGHFNKWNFVTVCYALLHFLNSTPYINAFAGSFHRVPINIPPKRANMPDVPRVFGPITAPLAVAAPTV